MGFLIDQEINKRRNWGDPRRLKLIFWEFWEPLTRRVVTDPDFPGKTEWKVLVC